jgi:hypothetical protein
MPRWSASRVPMSGGPASAQSLFAARWARRRRSPRRTRDTPPRHGARHCPRSAHLDGKLDENVLTVPGVSDFVQQVPREGAPATERTESCDVRSRYALHRGAGWDTAPPERRLRTPPYQSAPTERYVRVILDTFTIDAGFLFIRIRLAHAPTKVTGRGNLNVDWNPCDVRTAASTAGGRWKMAPFKSLRYRSG